MSGKRIVFTGGSGNAGRTPFRISSRTAIPCSTSI